MANRISYHRQEGIYFRSRWHPDTYATEEQAWSQAREIAHDPTCVDIYVTDEFLVPVAGYHAKMLNRVQRPGDARSGEFAFGPNQ